jgi:hypothetical protein
MDRATAQLVLSILNVAITWISWGVAPGYINIAPLGLFGISWGVAPGYINIAPLGLFGSYLSYERFLKKSFSGKSFAPRNFCLKICSLLEYKARLTHYNYSQQLWSVSVELPVQS